MLRTAAIQTRKKRWDENYDQIDAFVVTGLHLKAP